MAVQLSSSYLRHSYQVLATLSPKGQMTGTEAFQRATNIVYEWAKMKVCSIFPTMPYFKQSLDMSRDGRELGLLYNEDEEQFILRLSHIDEHIAGRMWITDVQICRSGEKYIFATRLSVSTLKIYSDDVPFSCPQFVRYISQKVGLSNEYLIQESAHMLSSKAEVDRLVQYLESPNREGAVVLVSPSYFPEEEKYNGYTVDADYMANELIGVAQVFKISPDIASYLRETMGKWSVYDGAIRTFYPGLAFEEEEYYRHPRLLREQILMRNTEENPNAAMMEVVNYICRFAMGRHIAWADSHIDFYLSAYQNYLWKQRTASVQSSEALIALYEETLAQSEQKCKENLEIAETYLKDYENEEEQNRQLRQRITQLRMHIAMLETRLEAVLKTGETIVSVDGNYENIPNWIEENYPGCLLLSPRAKRSLKKAVYEDVRLVYQCLQLLATSYYTYRTGGKTYDEFTNDMLRVDSGLKEAGAVTETAAGMYGDDYKIEYKGKKRLFERHIGKGTQKDPGKTMRIYFFWDEEDQIIVIGDLPAHLDNSLS